MNGVSVHAENGKAPEDMSKLSSLESPFGKLADAVEPHPRTSDTDRLLSDILVVLRSFSNHSKSVRDSESRKSEWMMAALLFDRLMLFVFIILTISLTLGILLKHPYYKPGELPPYWLKHPLTPLHTHTCTQFGVDKTYWTSISYYERLYHIMDDLISSILQPLIYCIEKPSYLQIKRDL